MSSLSFPRTFVASIALAAAVFSAGCASTYHVKVDASTRPEAARPLRSSFRIEDKTAPGQDGLRFKEVANQVSAALLANGFHRAVEPGLADIVVEISYGMGDEEVERTVYQEIAYGRPVPADGRIGVPPPGVAREMMGYAQIASSVVHREKYLSLRACTNRATGTQPPEDLWQVHASLEDGSDDLRGSLLVLATAAMEHIGYSTNGPVTLTLRSDDDAIQFMRRNALQVGE